MQIVFVLMLTISSCLKAQEIKVSEALENAAFEAYETIVLTKPSTNDPVSVGACVVWSLDKKTLAIVTRVEIAHGWHIYAEQKGTSAFIMTELKNEFPEGMVEIGERVLPEGSHYSEELDVFENDLLYITYYKLSDKLSSKVGRTGLYYQACDPNQCFPPATKMVELNF